MNNRETQNAARLIQKMARRKLYGNTIFKQLPLDKSQNYPAFLKANIDHHCMGQFKVAPGERVVMLSVSCLPGIEYALHFMNRDRDQFITPKIFILDHTVQTILFWRHFKAFFSGFDVINPSPEEIFNGLSDFFKDNIHLFIKSTYTPQQVAATQEECLRYTHALILANGYEIIRDIVLDATIIRGDWNDVEIFKTLQNVFKQEKYNNIFVYASNAATFNSENNTKKILNNIALLKPKFTMHLTHAPYARTTSHMIGCEIYDPTVLYDFLEKEIDHKKGLALHYDEESQALLTSNHLGGIRYNKLVAALDKMNKENHYDIEPTNSPFIGAIILKMAGIEPDIFACQFHNSYFYDAIIFHYRLPVELTEQYIEALNKRFPTLDARFPTLGENPHDPGHTLRIAVNATQLFNDVIPQIPAFLAENDFYRFYYQHILAAGMKNMQKLFANYHINVCDSNYLGKAICYIVTEHFAKQSIDLPYLMTASTNITPVKDNFLVTFIHITTPLALAQFIVNYFNSILHNSAYLAPEQVSVPNKKTLFTRLIMNNLLFINPQFLQALQKTIPAIQKEPSLHGNDPDYNEYSRAYATALSQCSSTLFNSSRSSFNTIQDVKRYAHEHPDSVAATVLYQMRRKG